MSKIQLVLLGSVFIMLLVYLYSFRNRIFNTLFFAGFFVVGMVLIIKPNLSQQTASFFGVGRGVDLVIYFLLVLFLFLFIALFYKLRHLSKTLSDMVRHRAIENAKTPETFKPL